MFKLNDTCQYSYMCGLYEISYKSVCRKFLFFTYNL